MSKKNWETTNKRWCRTRIKQKQLSDGKKKEREQERRNEYEKLMDGKSRNNFV